MDNDRRIARHHARPIGGRRGATASRARLLRAIAAIDDTLEGVQSLKGLVLAAEAVRKRKKAGEASETEDARAWNAVADGLLRAQRISWAQYVFTVGSAAEGIRDDRLFRGDYAEILPTTDESGANDVEYGRVLEQKLAEVLDELECTEIATLLRSAPAHYDELRERGRRFYFQKAQYEAALRDVVDQLYAGARAAANSAEYRAAITLLGASLEGHLLLRCFRSKHKARAVAAALPKRLRDRAGRDMRHWTFETLVEVCDKAKWFGTVDSEASVYNPAGLAHSLREMRNWIHPAREALNRPWQGVYAKDFELARALYLVALVALRGGRRLHLGAGE